MASPDVEFLKADGVTPTPAMSRTPSSPVGKTVFDGFPIGIGVVTIVTGIIPSSSRRTRPSTASRCSARSLPRTVYPPATVAHRGDRSPTATASSSSPRRRRRSSSPTRPRSTARIQLYIVGSSALHAEPERHDPALEPVAADRDRPEGARTHMKRSRVINAIGAVMSGTVLVVVLITKFMEGARYAILAMAVLFAMMLAIRRHYDKVSTELSLWTTTTVSLLPRTGPRRVPCRRSKPAMRALAYARASRATTFEALTVSVDQDDLRRCREEWVRREIPVPLKILASPYREITGPSSTMSSRSAARTPAMSSRSTSLSTSWATGTSTSCTTRAHSASRPGCSSRPGVMMVSVPWQLQSPRTGPRVGRRAPVHPARHPMTDGLAVGDEVELEVGAVAHGGHCVGARGGSGGLRPPRPARRTGGRAGHRGRRRRPVRPGRRGERPRSLVGSPRTALPVCRSGGCGGCDFQHADPEHGRALEAAVVSEQLRRLAKVDIDVVGAAPRRRGRAALAQPPALCCRTRRPGGPPQAPLTRGRPRGGLPSSPREAVRLGGPGPAAGPGSRPSTSSPR